MAFFSSVCQVNKRTHTGEDFWAILRGCKRSSGFLANNVFGWKLGCEVKGLVLYPLEKHTGSHSRAVQKAFLFLHEFWQRWLVRKGEQYKQLTVAPPVADQKQNRKFPRDSWGYWGSIPSPKDTLKPSAGNRRTIWGWSEFKNLSCLNFTYIRKKKETTRRLEGGC